MKILLAFCLVLVVSAKNCEKQPTSGASNFNTLVFSKTAGFRHQNIPDAIVAIKKLGQENGFGVDATEDAALFTAENLAKYKAVIFLNTTQDVLDDVQQAVFEKYVRSGGGFVGIHAAADTEYDWAWYGKLVGGYFESHPKIQPAVVRLKDGKHSSTKMLPAEWKRTDEWYNYKSLNPDVHVLLNLDESTYEGGKNGANHPIAWYHKFDGGRAFYTGGGHTSEAFSEPLFLQHLLGGIRWAAGK